MLVYAGIVLYLRRPAILREQFGYLVKYHKVEYT
jgi:hypothetical protein